MYPNSLRTVQDCLFTVIFYVVRKMLSITFIEAVPVKVTGTAQELIQ
jgi:hypothetical protein